MHRDVVAGARQVARRRQPAESGADDHDVRGVIGRDRRRTAPDRSTSRVMAASSTVSGREGSVDRSVDRRFHARRAPRTRRSPPGSVARSTSSRSGLPSARARSRRPDSVVSTRARVHEQRVLALAQIVARRLAGLERIRRTCRARRRGAGTRPRRHLRRRRASRSDLRRSAGERGADLERPGDGVARRLEQRDPGRVVFVSRRAASDLQVEQLAGDHLGAQER